MAAQSTSSAVVQGLVATATSKTLCTSVEQRGTKATPPLPHELLGICVEFALEDARVTLDGTALCKLLHVSHSTRCKVVQGFDKVQLLDCEPPRRPRTQPYKVRVLSALVHTMHRAVKRYMVLDFSERDKEDATSSDVAIDPDWTLAATDGSLVTGLTGRFQVDPYDLRLGSATVLHVDGVARNGELGEDSENHQPVSYMDVARVIEELLRGLDLPRILNPYQRALALSFATPVQGVDMVMELSFRIKPAHSDAPHQRCVRVWKYSTVDIVVPDSDEE